MIAHPGKVSSVAVSADGKYLFTCGGSDLSVNMWEIDPSVFQTALLASKSEDRSIRLAPFLDALEGGEYGQLYNELVDYFYYFQLRRQGEDCMDERLLQGEHNHVVCFVYPPGIDTIPVESIPDIMSAIGLYASEEEFQNMINEIRYSNFVFTGILQDGVTIEELIMLYVNHRPVEALIEEDVRNAFNLICSRYSQ